MDLDAARRWLKAIPGVRRFALSASGQALRHRVALHFEDREGFTFTQFFRSPSQLEALAGPVLEHVLAHGHAGPLRIVIIGCSSGAEPYTLSSILLTQWPCLTVTIDAYDIATDTLAAARAAAYPVATVLGNPLIKPIFIDATFDRRGDHLVVKPEVAQRVRFHHADALDPAIREQIAPADLVFAQNIMCNLRRPAARRLFDNIVALLKPRSALFVDGMDLDMRTRRTRAHRLVPLTFALRRIHDEARLVRGERYPWFASGLEPFSAQRRDRERRYATIFLRGGATD